MKTSIKKFQLHAALVLLAGLGPATTWAAATCSPTISVIVIDTQAPISSPRDAAPGTPLSGWHESEASTNWYNCTASAGTGTGVGMNVSLSATGQTKVVDGKLYNVYATGVNGIGVIVGGWSYAHACGWTEGGMGPLPNNTWRARACNGQGDVSNGGQLRVMFVQTGPIAAGALPQTRIAGARPVHQPLGIDHPVLLPGGAIINVFITGMSVRSQACSTSDVSVILDLPKVSVFSGKGSSSQVAPFEIALNNCPSGLNAIHYQIDAVTPIVDNANAVVDLDGSSSASGIGIQLLDGDGNPAILGTKRPFTGYNGATGGNFKIPLRARYRQTGDTITPGSANSAVTFTMSYL
ncbi:fimbrial protein [Achromobacter spanius]|uniref:fimbrial protein n=1 Tax=Achromobacter spanius TaxID=217203 RepID=UPI00382AF3C5